MSNKAAVEEAAAKRMEQMNTDLLLTAANLFAPAREHEQTTRTDVIGRFCSLSSRVAREQFDSMEAGDCFCEGGPSDPYGYRFSEKILAFIEAAVDEKLRKSGD